MRRWVFVLVAIVAVLWFWRSWGNGEVAVESGDVLAQSTRVGDAQPTVPSQAAEAAGVPPVLSAPLHGASAPASAGANAGAGAEEDVLCAAVRRRDPAALAVGYRKLLDRSGAPQHALAEALAAAAGEEAASMLAALGEGNAFLHIEVGREAGRRVVRAAQAAPGEGGLRIFTGFLERAMRGTIEKADAGAAALVDEAYAAMQGVLNRTVFNPEFTAGARTHQVAHGESLERIAAAYRKQGLKVDGLTLGLFNRITDPTKLRQGQVIKIPAEPISTVLEKRSYLMALYVGDVIFRLYWVGHGKDDRTPETTFTIGTKHERPDWHFEGRVIPYGHPDNILGGYFVKFDHVSFQGYGAHGTPEPATIGTMASRGCIRMRDADIREFFQVVPRGTPVLVRATQNTGSR